MISGCALSIAPLSVRVVELGIGVDIISISITTLDNGITVIGLVSEIGNISISTTDIGISTSINTKSDSISITTKDFGWVSIIATIDVTPLSISTSDSAIITLFGSDYVALNISGSKSNQVRIGTDTITVNIANYEIGHYHISGKDANVITITLDDFGYVVVSGTSETWVLNLSSSGHTKYTNYNFNSFSRIGNDYFGFSPSGIYKLSGDKDVTEDINAIATTGVTDFGINTYIHDAYLLLRSEGDMGLSTIVEETRQSADYKSPYDYRDGVQRRRVKLAKGLNGNTWQFTITNIDGADFMLKQLEVIPLKSKRRI